MLYLLIVALVITSIGWYKNYQIRMTYARIMINDKTELMEARQERVHVELKKLEFKEQRDDYKFHLERMIEEHSRRCDERDEAREVAEKFRDKYIALKNKDNLIKARAELEMQHYTKNKELNSGWR